MKRSPKYDSVKFGYHDTWNSDTSKEIALGAAGHKANTDNGRYGQAIGYVDVGGRMRPHYTYEGKAGVGLYRTAGNFNNVFNKNRNPLRNDGDFDVKALSTGVDAEAGLMGFGLMGRASLFDANINLGPVGFNAGVGVDTGTKVDSEGGEVKFMGIGGKVDKHGVQGCFVICGGINW